MKTLTVFDRPGNKGVSFPLTDEQKTFRMEFAKALTEQIQENLTELGAFVTPGNDAEKGTVMVALSLPMPAISFINDEGETETTRPYNLNINAVIPLPGANKQDAGGEAQPIKALTYTELRARQLAATIAKKARK